MQAHIKASEFTAKGFCPRCKGSMSCGLANRQPMRSAASPKAFENVRVTIRLGYLRIHGRIGLAGEILIRLIDQHHRFRRSQQNGLQSRLWESACPWDCWDWPAPPSARSASSTWRRIHPWANGNVHRSECAGFSRPPRCGRTRTRESGSGHQQRVTGIDERVADHLDRVVGAVGEKHLLRLDAKICGERAAPFVVLGIARHHFRVQGAPQGANDLREGSPPCSR